MKKLYFIIGLLLGVTVYAQNPDAMQKIEAAKIALITERLNLTPDQAEQFWPIYNEFSNRQREIRKEYTDLRKNINPQTATEEQNKQLLEVGMKVKENQLTLERQYSQRMLNVISNRQMVSLRKAEEDFRKLLLERMRQRQERRKQIQNQNNKRLQGRNKN